MLIWKKSFRNLFFIFFILCAPSYLFSDHYSTKAINSGVRKENDLIDKSKIKASVKYKNLSYYLNISDFISSFIEIPTFNVLSDSSTVSSKYLAGRAPIYNSLNEKVGVCSASFLCMQNADGIFTDISNYLSVDNGLVISWFTPSTLINLELDSIVHSMVTECIVIASTKIGFNPFYGKKFNMIVSSDSEKIYFKLSEI